VISLLAGVAFSPHATNLIRAEEYALHSEQNLEYINLYFTRLVLGVQLVVCQYLLSFNHEETRSPFLFPDDADDIASDCWRSTAPPIPTNGMEISGTFARTWNDGHVDFGESARLGDGS
jgi:hypothetical protein